MKIHNFLWWENKQRKMYNKNLPIINRLTYDLEKAIGKEVWTDLDGNVNYSLIGKPSMHFVNLDRHIVTIVKNFLGIDAMKKEITEYYVSLSTELDNGIEVEFRFGLPSSCKVEKEIDWKSVDTDTYRVVNGKIQQKTERVVKVDCGEKSMLKAIFGEEV